MCEPDIRLQSQPGRTDDQPTRMRDTPFCIVVLGDFGGSGLREASDTDRDSPRANWRPLRATPETVMKLAGLEPTIPMGPGLRCELTSLDAFHPDHLFETTDAFEALRKARAALREGRNPESESPMERVSGHSKNPPGTPMEEDPGLLDAIVERAEPTVSARRGPADELREFVREAVRGHTVQETPDRSADIALVDQAAGELMRSVLHEPRVQALEALWRGLAFLLSNTDTTGKVRVYLVDVPRTELEHDLLGSEDLSQSKTTELLLGLAPDGIPHPWALAVGAYVFDESDSDIELLSHIAAVAEVSRISWISEGSTRLAGCASLTDSPHPEDWEAAPSSWSAFRSMSGAGHIVLAAPSFVVREPYGAAGQKTRRFGFEEQSRGDGSEVLWANPAFACALVLARAFADRAPDAAATAHLDLDAMPSAQLEDDGAPPHLTHARLTPSGATRLVRMGLTPLIEFPREARIRVGGLRSAASNGSEPRAWWSDSVGS